MSTQLDLAYTDGFVRPHEMDAIWPQVRAAHEMLHQKTGPGNTFLGWLDLPESYDKEEFVRIKAAASFIQKNSQVLVVIGIGGSYLGARAAIEFIKSPFYNSLPKDTPDVYFVGNSISPTYLNEILTLCGDRDICVNVISKSGTTTEPALAFRVFRNILEKKYGKEGARSRIFCTTDPGSAVLKGLAQKEGYEIFSIPSDVGGRFSVLSAVGLLPIAAAGCDVDEMLRGANQACHDFSQPDMDNACYRYAAMRNILRGKGKLIEVMVSYEPSFAMLFEWAKQLFGESEGKDGKGIFPASMIFSTDLHSLGQFVQDGTRAIFETVFRLEKPKVDFYIEKDPEDFDGMNFLAEQDMSVVNDKALKGTLLAHMEGGVPNMMLKIPEANEYELGYLVYFLEKACAVSGYLLGVNPFDQPGVEAYKNNMFALLGKPGYEEMKAMLEAKL